MNAPCRGEADEEACPKYRNAEQEREHLIVAILVLVDACPFQLFTLTPRKTRLSVHEEVMQYDDTFLTKSHFAETAVIRLALWTYTSWLKARGAPPRQ